MPFLLFQIPLLAAAEVHALGDLLLLQEEGADDTLADLVVRQNAAVRALDRRELRRAVAGVARAEAAGTREALVAHRLRSVGALDALLEVVHGHLAAGGAHQLEAVALRVVLELAAVRDALNHFFFLVWNSFYGKLVQSEKKQS